MRFFNEFGKGISTHWKALEFLVKNGLWYYFIFPLLIGGVMFLFGIYSMNWVRDWMAGEVREWLGLDGSDGWLSSMLGWLVNLLSWFIMLLITYFFLGSFSKYMTLTILSPVMALLSEKVEEIITGKKYPFVFSHFVKDVLRGILVVFRNMFLEYLIIFIVFLLGFIPVIGWVIGILSLPFLYALSAYFMGFSMMDYTCERQRMRISQGAAFVNKHKGFAIGNGLVFSLLLMIPVLGIMLAPILSVTAATIGSLELLHPQPQQNPNFQQQQQFYAQQQYQQQQYQQWQQQQQQQQYQQQQNPPQNPPPQQGFEDLYKKYYGNDPTDNPPPQS